MSARLILRLEGERAHLGELRAADLARLLTGTDRVINRTAIALAARRPRSGGWLPREIAGAVVLRLRSMSGGSVVLELELRAPSPDSGAFDLEVTSLGEAALQMALDVLDGSESEFGDTVAAWSQMASELDIGGRYESLTGVVPSRARPETVLDETARSRLAAALQQRGPSDAPGGRAGTLHEAGFEKNFADLCTHEGASVFELARTQGVAPVESLKELQDDTITEAEAEAFMAALGL